MNHKAVKMKLFNHLQILILFSISLLALLATPALHASQKPILQPTVITSNTDNPAAHLRFLQSQLSDRLSKHKVAISFHLNSMYSRLAVIESSIDSSIVDIHTLKQVLEQGSNNQAFEILKQLAFTVGDIANTRANSKEVAFEEILEEVKEIDHEMDDLEVFMQDIKRKIVATTVQLSSDVDGSENGTTNAGSTRYH
jgi:hypothetical protein